MGTQKVTLKGIKDGIMVILDADASMEELCRAVQSKLCEVVDFFRSGSSRLLFSGRLVGAMERIALEQAAMEVLPKGVVIEYEGDGAGLPIRQAAPRTADKSKFHHGTLRSGQSLKSLGNLVVVGDVNPGAELIAVGNIVVMGALRGIVHAGCNGDRDAIVAAVKMSPTQLRIADLITRPPDGEEQTEWVPEIAYIRDGNIYIDDYLAKIR